MEKGELCLIGRHHYVCLVSHKKCCVVVLKAVVMGRICDFSGMIAMRFVGASVSVRTGRQMIGGDSSWRGSGVFGRGQRLCLKLCSLYSDT